MASAHLNKALEKFYTFACRQVEEGNTTSIAHISKGSGDGERTVGKAEGDSIYRWRDAGAKDMNNYARKEFFKAVSKLFGGQIPKSVQDAMLLKDYGEGVSFSDSDSWTKINSGKPLTARRIKEVVNAIDVYQNNHGVEDTVGLDYDIVGRTDAEQKGRDWALQLTLDPPSDMESFFGAVLGKMAGLDEDVCGNAGYGHICDRMGKLLATERRAEGKLALGDMLKVLEQVISEDNCLYGAADNFICGLLKGGKALLEKNEQFTVDETAKAERSGNIGSESNIGGPEDDQEGGFSEKLGREMKSAQFKKFFDGLKIHGLEGRTSVDSSDLLSEDVNISNMFNRDDPRQEAFADELASLYREPIDAKKFVHYHERAMEKFDATVNDLTGHEKILWAAMAAKFKESASGVYKEALNALSPDDRTELMKWRYMRMGVGTEQKMDAAHVKQFIWNELTSLVPQKLRGTKHGRDVFGKLTAIAADLSSGDAARVKTGGKHLKALLKECQDQWWGHDAKLTVSIEALCRLVATTPAQVKAELQAEFLNNDVADLQAILKANPNNNNAVVARWQWERASDADYQLKAMALFGNDIEPLTCQAVEEKGEKDFHSNTAKLPETLWSHDKTGYPSENGLEEILVNRHGTAAQTVAGDTTNFMGYPSCSTQEENVLRCASPALQAVLIKKGYIEPFVMSKDSPFFRGEHMYKYTLNDLGLPKLSSWRGFTIKAHMISTNGRPLQNHETPKEFWLVFGASTSFTCGDSRDVNGFVSTLYRLHETDQPGVMKPPFTGDKVHDAKLIQNAKNFYLKVCSYINREVKHPTRNMGAYSGLARVGFGREDSKLYHEMMFMAAYLSQDKAPFNRFGDNSDDEVEKLFDFIENGQYENEMADAVANHEKTIDWQYGNECNLVYATGAENLLQITAGAGVFGAPEGKGAAAFARHAVTKLGKLNILEPRYSSFKDGNGGYTVATPIKNAMEAEQKKIVVHLRKEGCNDDEIREVLANEGREQKDIDAYFGLAKAEGGENRNA